MSNVTIDDIKDALHKLDLIQRPYVCFIHPDRLDELKEICPDIEDQVLFEPIDIADKDKCYMMKREELEEWAKPRIEVDHE